MIIPFCSCPLGIELEIINQKSFPIICQTYLKNSMVTPSCPSTFLMTIKLSIPIHQPIWDVQGLLKTPLKTWRISISFLKKKIKIILQLHKPTHGHEYLVGCLRVKAYCSDHFGLPQSIFSQVKVTILYAIQVHYGNY